MLVGLLLVYGEVETQRGERREEEGEGGRTKGTVDLDALDTVFLSISWVRHVGWWMWRECKGGNV